MPQPHGAWMAVWEPGVPLAVTVDSSFLPGKACPFAFSSHPAQVLTLSAMLPWVEQRMSLQRRDNCVPAICNVQGGLRN